MPQGFTSTYTPDDPNSGHGWVYPRDDGKKANCGGILLCESCQLDMQVRTGDTDASALGFKLMASILERVGKKPEPVNETPRPKIEPSADIRDMSSTVAQMYTGLIDEGLTHRQAVDMVGAIFKAAQTPPEDGQ